MTNNLVVFILTNGRPEKVVTYKTLRSHGYTGKIYLLVDDLDKTKDEYIKLYKDEVIIFDKKAIAKTFDQGDNFNDMRAIVYARNASFEVAKNLGIKYFIQLDDDYIAFVYRFNNKFIYKYKKIKNLDKVFNHLLTYYISSGISSLAFLQGGDFIGGEDSGKAKAISLYRKAMNSFICSTDRPFKFVGRINEDINSYTHLASKGLLFLSTNQVSLTQLQTQSNSGGMTELYLDSGTYIKSFYSVMYQPSSVKIFILKDRLTGRLHHKVNWKCTVPKILRESIKKI